MTAPSHSGPLTLEAAGEVVERLCAAYGRPYGVRAKALVRVWFDRLDGIPDGAVRAAVDWWIDREPKWPPISAIRQRAKALADPGPTGDLGLPYTCPGCGSEPTLRTWLVARLSTRDARPTVVTVERGGRVVDLVEASRLLCDCQAREMILRLSREDTAALLAPEVRAHLGDRALAVPTLRLLPPVD